MKNLKGILVVLVALASLSLILMGCSPAPTVSDPDPVVPVDTTVRLTDHLDRSVELSAPAERVIGTHNPTNNLLVVLDGNGSRFVGFGSKDKAFGLYDIVAPEIDTIPQIGRGRELNIESIMTVNPDLLILPIRSRDQIDQMKEIGVESIALDFEKFDSIKDALTLVGKAIGQDERAAQIVAYFDGVISEVSQLAAGATKKPRVLMLGSSNTRVSTDAMLQNLMMETAGGENVTAGFQSDGFWADVNIEQIIAWNPEVIFLPVYANYSVGDLLNDPAWSEIEAIKQKKVYQFPSKLEPWDYPVAASSLGLCWTLHTLHPELFPFEQLMENVDEYYQLVYGQTFSAEQLGIAP